MPYGIDKQSGGDTKENDLWMENCVKQVMKSGKDKGTAVAICKVSLRRKKEKEKQKNVSSSINFTITDL